MEERHILKKLNLLSVIGTVEIYSYLTCICKFYQYHLELKEFITHSFDFAHSAKMTGLFKAFELRQNLRIAPKSHIFLVYNTVGLEHASIGEIDS